MKRTRRMQPSEPGEQGSDVELALDRKLRAKGWWFDTLEADRVVKFFHGVLRHSQGALANKPFILAPWQLRLVRRLFGWRRPNGTRRYRRCAWWIPKKNGKSTLAAGVALYLLSCDGEPGAQVYCAASSKDQASIVFDEAKNMVSGSPLSDEMVVRKESIHDVVSGSVCKVISAKPGTKHGFSPSALIIDEVHAIKDRELYDVLTRGVIARRQPLEFVISTAGTDIGSWGFELYEYTMQVRDGVIEDPEFMAVVYAADPHDKWDSPEVWKKANPNLGISFSIDALEGVLTQTRGMPGALANFKQLHLNIWSQAVTAWLPIDKWRKCLVPARKVRQYKGRVCYGGLDLSATEDLTSLGLLFDGETEKDPLELVVFFWLPADTIAERESDDGVMYRKWVDAGFIRTTPGNVIDYDFIEKDIARVARFVQLKELAFDKWQALHLIDHLQNRHSITTVEHRQGYASMTAPSTELYRLVVSKKIRIVANPVLTWQASTVVTRRDPAGNIKPDKSNRRHRIDGIVASVMGLSRSMIRVKDESVYETRGVIAL